MAKVKSFSATSAISFKDAKENWYKVSCGLEVEVEEGDDFAKVKETTWNTVHSECEKQIMDILNAK